MTTDLTGTTVAFLVDTSGPSTPVTSRRPEDLEAFDAALLEALAG